MIALPFSQQAVSPRRRLRALLIAAALAFAGSALADALSDAQKLAKQAQYPQALEKLETHLAANPKDAQGRFLKGVILTETNKANDAIAVFSQIIEDYPELPEPYNNLAVLYAQQRQFDRARAALEMAIRTNPSYAVAHENLGDIFAKLASQAYEKALQLDPKNTSLQSKTGLLRETIATGNRPAKAAAPAGTATK